MGGGYTLVFPFPEGGTTTDFVESVSTSLGIKDTKLARSVGNGISKQTKGVYSNSDGWSGTALEKQKKKAAADKEGAFKPGGFITIGNDAQGTGGTIR